MSDQCLVNVEHDQARTARTIGCDRLVVLHSRRVRGALRGGSGGAWFMYCSFVWPRTGCWSDESARHT